MRRKVADVFGNTLSNRDKQSLATLIYYPREKMAQILKTAKNPEDWYKITLYRLIEISKRASSKYTRSKVRKALPPEFAYVIEELMTEKADIRDKESYYNAIVATIIRVGRAGEFIVALCELIQRLVVDHLHILGDIYDRGPGPHKIMDKLMEYHSLDIQWGNHDVLWMGAAAGQPGCIANVIRICARYGNLDILEDGYGINLLPLATFALETYGEDPCSCFALKGSHPCSPGEKELNLRMHKAISVIQFKVEGQLIREHPEFNLESRLLLHRINYENGTIVLDGKQYTMKDMYFPTVDPADPYRLSAEETAIMKRLEQAFLNCEKLQQHMRFLLSKGSLYKVYNKNLLYHGCMPLCEDGKLKEVKICGELCKGRQLYDVLESYFLADRESHTEKKNSYYRYLEDEKTADMILAEFGLQGEDSHIINGHMPVKSKNGENPIKCGGKVLVIDGGFSKAYQKETGIAGYTLIYNSYGFILAAHEPFESRSAAIEQESDIYSDDIIVKRTASRKLVGDTDTGQQLKEKIGDLEQLLKAYREGRIAERFGGRF